MADASVSFGAGAVGDLPTTAQSRNIQSATAARYSDAGVEGWKSDRLDAAVLCRVDR